MTASQPNSVVLGATGHIGNAITRELLERGHRVTAVTRRQRPDALAGLNVTVMQGDVDHPGQIADCLRGQDVVIDAAAPYPLNLFRATIPGERAPLAYARQRMFNILDAVSRQGAALGFVSSFTTLPRPASEGVLATIEARARRSLHPYFPVKAMMEQMVVEAARGGLRAAILNPTACIGPWDRRRRELCIVPQLMAGQVPATVTRVVNVIDVRDVAAAVRAAVEQSRFGRPIPLAGHNSRSDALVARICHLAGVSAPRFKVSARLAAGGALWAETVWALVGQPSPLPTIGLLLILDGYATQPSAEQRALGVLPRPLDETLRDSIAWYRRLGYC